jgi:hypothetical protein
LFTLILVVFFFVPELSKLHLLWVAPILFVATSAFVASWVIR